MTALVLQLKNMLGDKALSVESRRVLTIFTDILSPKYIYGYRFTDVRWDNDPGFGKSGNYNEATTV